MVIQSIKIFFFKTYQNIMRMQEYAVMVFPYNYVH